MKAIEVDGDKLTINEKRMKMFKFYKFKYLDVDMIAVRRPNGVDLLQEIKRDEINNYSLV